MHPFFATGPNRSDAHLLANQDVPSPGLSFDGASDKRPVSSQHLNDLSKDQNSSCSDAQKAPAGDKPHKATSTRPTALSEQPQNIDLESDPNCDRRKRRKTKSTDGQETTETHVSNIVTSSTAWRDQLEEAAAESPQGINLLTSSAPTLILPSSTPQQSPRKTRRSPRSAKTAKRLEQTRLENVDRSAAAPGPQSITTTPKKKMLKLDASGKLVIPAKSSGPSPKKLVSRPASSVQLKHGKLASSLRVILRYGTDPETRNRIGLQIEGILTIASDHSRKQCAGQTNQPQWTHPFFLGKISAKRKAGQRQLSAGSSLRGQESDRETSPAPSKSDHVDWKDIVFKSKKTSQVRAVGQADSIWPPGDLQHVGREDPYCASATPSDVALIEKKQKDKRVSVDEEENVLFLFQKQLETDTIYNSTTFTRPVRQILTAKDVQSRVRAEGLACLDANRHDVTAFAEIYQCLSDYINPFDLGNLDSNMDWASKYAPQKSSQVLQPGCMILRDWLSQLSVRNVRSTVNGSKKDSRATVTGRKRRRLKRVDDLDDFIASSDDDLSEVNPGVKNAILITGPSGCGKTAAVLAVAKELDFEVFEIHPGMRRSAKDIFDKVGNMTQNHLVKGKPQSHGAQTSPTRAPPDNIRNTAAKSKPVRNSLQSKSDKIGHGKSDEIPSKRSSRQKESLVLFEEVDILFDDDKSFWTGVTALIEQSRRPVVLSCNDRQDVPLDELPLHAILEFSQPPVEVAGLYLTAIAAKEGHLLDVDAVSTLYRSNRRDFRASLTALQFWCQLTLGSHQGGLDWMLDQKDTGTNSTGSTKIRVMSRDTYRQGLDLLPSIEPAAAHRSEEVMRLASAEYDLHPLAWHHTSIDSLPTVDFDEAVSAEQRLDVLGQIEQHRDALSLFDLAQPEILPSLSAFVPDLRTRLCHSIDRAELTQARLSRLEDHPLSHADLLDAFELLKIEKPIFPPAMGRLAPSLEGSSAALPVDIAPYVRCIVAFDQRLEQQRMELAGVSFGTKKTRTTRAARAALEGGSKASTRRERWFSPHMDAVKVLRTGDEWPLWRPEVTKSSADQSEVEGPSRGARQDDAGSPMSSADRGSPNQRQ